MSINNDINISKSAATPMALALTVYSSKETINTTESKVPFSGGLNYAYFYINSQPMSKSADKVKKIMKTAERTARLLLSLGEDVPYVGTVVKLIIKLIEVCDQLKCNQEAGEALQERFFRITSYLLDGPHGLVEVARARSDNASLEKYCALMKDILEKGTKELEKFTKGGFFKKLLWGSIPKELFEGLDRDMTQCLNELAAVLSSTLLIEQAKMYDVVCNIEHSIEQYGGLQALIADQVQMQRLAVRIGADIDNLNAEVQSALDSISEQVSAVDEVVRGTDSKVDSMREDINEIKRNTAKNERDLADLELTSRPHVDRTKFLGVGAFSKVYQGSYTQSDFAVAVKVFNTLGLLSAAQLKELSREVLMHSKVANLPGVVRLFGANLTLEPRCIVLELADGSLHDALHKKTLAVDFTLPVKLSLAAQLCSTMAAVSAMNIIHRDIKSANVLLFLQSGRDRVLAKLSDFGLTKVVNESTMTHAGAAAPKGTLPYMAPELFSVSPTYSSASDMYAFAVLLNELMTELVPYPVCLNIFQIAHSVTGSGLRPDVMKPDDNDAIGKELLPLVNRCWDQDPALRMGFHELAAELTHLLRKAVEHAQQGNHAAPLTPPVPSSAVSSSAAQSVPSTEADPQPVTPQPLPLPPQTAALTAGSAANSPASAPAAAPDGSVPAADECVRLGDSYYDGTGERQNDAEAVRYYELAAEQGDKIALFRLGRSYKYGRGVVANIEKAVEYYQKAADKKYLPALHSLGDCYYYGNGVSVDYTKAYKYYESAADQGQSDAQYKVGRCYYKGHGVSVDYDEAAKYYELAADRGHKNAQQQLVLLREQRSQCRLC